MMGASLPRHLVTAPSYPVLEAALLDALEQGAGGASTIVLVRTPLLAEHLVRRLTARGLDVRARVMPVDALVRRLASPVGSAPVRGAAAAHLRAVTRDVGSSTLARLLAHAGGQRSLLTTFEAVRAGGYVEPGAFEAVAAALPEAPARLRDLAALFERFERVAGFHMADGSAVRRAALGAAASFSDRLDAGALALYGVTVVSAYERRLLERLAGVAPFSAYLPFPAAPSSADARAFAGVRPLYDWLLSLDFAPEHRTDDGGDANLDVLRRFWPAAVSIDEPRIEDASVAVVSAPNPAREVREAAREILRAARRGIPFGDMAVLYRQGETYAALVHETLTRLGIPVRREYDAPLDRRPAGRAVRQLLLLAHGPLRRGAVMEFVTSAPLRDASSQVWPERPADLGRAVYLPPGTSPSRWDQLSRRAGVVRGADQWNQRLDAFVARCQAEAPHRGNAARARLLEDAAEADKLRAYLRDLFARLAILPERATWPLFTERLRALAQDVLDNPDLAETLEALDTLAALEAIEGETSFDVFREAALARLADQRLAEAAVDNLTPGPSPATLARGAYGVAVESASSVAQSWHPRPDKAPLSSYARKGPGVRLSTAAVLCSDLIAAQGLRFRLVCVLGMVEGQMPGVPREDPLLPDGDRAALGLETSVEVGLREQAAFKLLLGAATERLVLLASRTEAGGARPHQPSYFLLKAGGTLLGRRLGFAEAHRIPGYTRVPAASFAPEDPADALDETEFDLAMIERALAGQGDASYLQSLDPDLYRRAATIEQRWRGWHFGPLDGAIESPDALAVTAARIVGRTISPTAIERYAGCPQRYFLEHLLDLEEADEPETIERIAARERGGLMHEVLERFFRQMLEEGTLPLRAERLSYYRGAMLEVLEQRCEEEAHRGRTGHALLWAIDRAGMADDLIQLLDDEVRQEAKSGDGYVPVLFEQSFGRDGETAVEHTLADGRVLRFGGIIDRVDRAPDGRTRVIDYKTGRAWQTAADRFGRGEKMQAPVYLLAARQRLSVDLDLLRAELYYCTRLGNYRRAPFSGAALAERADDLDRILTTVTDGIAAGRFFPYPGENRVNCRICPFEHVCDNRVNRLWARKRSDPAAAAFIEMKAIL